MTHHSPFKQVEEARPDFDKASPWELTKTPDPSWAIGQGVNDLPWPKATEATWLEVDPTTKPKGDIYRMMISGVNPRPIAFISTVNKEGVTNLAPFSFFNLVSPNPPTLMVSITHDKPPARKETCANILDTKEFVVNIISEAFVEAANSASIDCPADVSEFDVSGLTPLPSKTVKAPRVGESAFSMECKLIHHYDLLSPTGTLSSTVLLGQISLFHVRDDIVDPVSLTIDEAKLHPVARMGGITYARTTSTFEIPRPSWKAEEGTEEMRKVLEGEKE